MALRCSIRLLLPADALLLFLVGCGPSQSYSRCPETAMVSPIDAPLEGPATAVVVDAKVAWMSTGVYLKKGDTAQVSAQGTWFGGGGWCGPAGFPRNVGNYGNYEDPRFPYMALLGRIGQGKPFLIGSGSKVTATDAGMLRVVTNDPFDALFDNVGSVTVVIRRCKTSFEPDTRSSGLQQVSVDLRIIQVADAVVLPGGASGSDPRSNLEGMAASLAVQLKRSVGKNDQSIALISLRNRSGTKQGKEIAEELADKLTVALANTKWFTVIERINLRSFIDEKRLDQAGIVKNPDVRKKLSGVKYIVIGGVTVSDASGKGLWP